MMPNLYIRQKLHIEGQWRDADSGDTLEVLSTDSGSVKDFGSFCKATGNTLLEQDETEGVYRFLLQK